MKSITYLLFAGLAALLELSQPAKAEEPKKNNLSLAARIDALSVYNFRGFRYSEGPVAQIIPSATYRNASLIGFVNCDYATGQINETDLTADLTRQFKKFTLSVGYSYLSFPNTGASNTQEVYAVVSLDTFLRPTIREISDIDKVRGDYFEGTIGHDFKINGHTISATALLAYNNHFLIDKSRFSHWIATVALPMPITNKITITPSINYSNALDRTDFEDMAYFGISVNFGGLNE